MEEAARRLATNLRRLRTQRRLSQQSLAELSGVPRPTVALLESGAANPTLSVLMRVAAALGVTLEALVGHPPGRVRHYPARALPERTLGVARARELLPDAGPGLSLERLELPAGARIVRRPSSSKSRCYVVCEVGEVELLLGAGVWRVAAGEVLAFDAEELGGYVNPTRRKAVCYSVTAPATLG